MSRMSRETYLRWRIPSRMAAWVALPVWLTLGAPVSVPAANGGTTGPERVDDCRFPRTIVIPDHCVLVGRYRDGVGYEYSGEDLIFDYHDGLTAAGKYILPSSRRRKPAMSEATALRLCKDIPLVDSLMANGVSIEQACSIYYTRLDSLIVAVKVVYADAVTSGEGIQNAAQAALATIRQHPEMLRPEKARLDHVAYNKDDGTYLVVQQYNKVPEYITLSGLPELHPQRRSPHADFQTACGFVDTIEDIMTHARDRCVIAIRGNMVTILFGEQADAYLEENR
jgi:hypothetical protein